MSLPVDLLRNNNADVGALMTEAWLNHFSERHHAHGGDFYQGEYDVTEFEQRISVKYIVQNPIRFDLSPIPTSRFFSIWKSHLEAKGSKFFGHGSKLDAAIRAFTPPNLRLSVERMLFSISIFKEDGSEDFTVDFEWDVEARCAVLLVDAEKGSKAIRLEPIKVEFSKSPADLHKDILSALKKVAQSRQNIGTKESRAFGDPADPRWCAKVEQFLLFIINQVLAIQLTNFLREWDLPRGLDLHDSVSIVPHFIGIQDNMLIAGAQVHHATALDSRFIDEAHAIMRQFRRRFEQEMAEVSDAELQAWKTETSPSIQWLRKKREEVENHVNWARESQDKAAKSGHEENVALLANDRLFDAVAKTFLYANEGETFEKELDFIVRVAAGWWFRIFGASGVVTPGGFNVSAQFDMGGFAEGCIPNLDPKHWGEWACERICIIFRTRPNDPFALNTELNFWSRGIYGTFRLSTQRFEFDFCEDLPWPISELFDWIKSIFEQIFTDFLRLVIALVQVRIYKYPRYFPGTGLEWTPRMNTPARNEAEFLVISGDPQFS